MQKQREIGEEYVQLTKIRAELSAERVHERARHDNAFGDSFVQDIASEFPERAAEVFTDGANRSTICSLDISANKARRRELDESEIRR